MKHKSTGGVGIAIIGAGRVGAFRGDTASRHPSVGWIGYAETNDNRGKLVADRVGADFLTKDYRELVKRPEVSGVVVATDEHIHVEPVLAALEYGKPVLIEKPLATSLEDSQKVLDAIEASGTDAVVGYTQRFRRKWISGKEKVQSGALGDVTLVTSRVFMNRLVALECYKRAPDPTTISPMVVSGTHALDVTMWYLSAKTPVEVYARSIDTVMAPLCRGQDATAGMIMFSDGTILHLSISWALPVTWPGAVYSLDVGITGTEGVLTIDDTHRDMVMAVTKPQAEGYAPDQSRLVDFLGSYPPGDMAFGTIHGPMAEETTSWITRVATGQASHATTAREAHTWLMLCKALDVSAATRKPVKLPMDAAMERELLARG